MYKATVIVKRRPTILDPEGKAVEQGAKLLGFNNINGTRIGKYIEFFVDTDDFKAAEGEGTCSGDKAAEGEGHCGEGKEHADGEASCGGEKAKEGEGSCGEGSCGG